MIASLYEPFKHWSGTGSVYLYSDPHFGDEEMKYIRKNYISDEEQIKRINDAVHKNDTLIILGDIGDKSYISKLKAGYKVLIKGNHDKGNYNYIKKNTPKFFFNRVDATLALNDKTIDTYNAIVGWNDVYKYIGYKCNNLFDEVYSGPLFISDKILLSHEPIDLPFVLNIHGHDHSNQINLSGKHINVCAELIDYTPVNLGTIINSGLMKDIKNIHRLTIDNQIKGKKEKSEIINFIEEVNKHKVSKEFLDTCKKAGELFKKGK